MPPAYPSPELRASDADREAAVERLRRAALEGRLDSDELEQRIGAAYAARWVGELARLTSDVTPPAPPVPYWPEPPRTQTTNGLAVASMIAGIVWMWWLGSICAVVFGHVALGQIKRSNGWQTGRGMAIAGLVLGYIGMATLLVTILVAAGS
jgi:hypothetical protein